MYLFVGSPYSILLIHISDFVLVPFTLLFNLKVGKIIALAFVFFLRIILMTILCLLCFHEDLRFYFSTSVKNVRDFYGFVLQSIDNY